MDLEEIVARLNQRSQRATYGAVAGVVGVIARGLMGGRPRDARYSWIVAKTGPKRGRPTGYADAQIHKECLRQIQVNLNKVIDDAGALREWLAS